MPSFLDVKNTKALENFTSVFTLQLQAESF